MIVIFTSSSSMLSSPRCVLVHDAAAGDKKGAIDLAKKSMAGAKEAGNQNYVKQNTDSLKEWGAM